MKAYSRGAFVTVENDRDLGEGSVAGVTQRDDLGVGRRQLGDGIRQHILEVGALGHLLGQWLFVNWFDNQRTFVGVVGHAERHRAPTSNHIDAAVARNAKQPWRDGLAFVELAEMGKELHERFLGDVGGIVSAAEHAQAEVVEPTLVTTHQRLEGRGIATAGGEDLLALERERAGWA